MNDYNDEQTSAIAAALNDESKHITGRISYVGTQPFAVFGDLAFRLNTDTVSEGGTICEFVPALHNGQPIRLSSDYDEGVDTILHLARYSQYRCQSPDEFWQAAHGKWHCLWLRCPQFNASDLREPIQNSSPYTNRILVTRKHRIEDGSEYYPGNTVRVEMNGETIERRAIPCLTDWRDGRVVNNPNDAAIAAIVSEYQRQYPELPVQSNA